MITLKCPSCGKILNIQDKYAGQTGQCKGCGNKISVPIPFPPVSESEHDVVAEIQAQLDASEKNNPFKKPPVIVEDDETPGSAWNALTPQQRGSVIGCLLTVFLFGSVLATCSYVLTPSEETKRKIAEEEKWGSPSMAYIMSQEYVCKQLKSPSSADFPMGDYDARPGVQRGVYSVRGYCDAQNAFGTMIRIDYTCTMRCRDGRWTCEAIDLRERK